jgi:hypothetical protein
MTLGEALIARAKADPGVAAIAGENVFWVERSQGIALPALVLQTISGDRPEDLDGASFMRTTRVQLSCFALAKDRGGGGYQESRDLAEAAIAALLPEAEVEGIAFWRATASEPADLGADTDTGFIFHAAADLVLRWMTIA